MFGFEAMNADIAWTPRVTERRIDKFVTDSVARALRLTLTLYSLWNSADQTAAESVNLCRP